MNPLISSLANQALQMKLRQLIRLDPFWQEKLAQLDGVRIKLILTDNGFKRVFQLGPTDLHLAPPFTEADFTLTTRSIHLPKLLDAQALAQAFDEGHCYLIGDPKAFDALLDVLRVWQLDWEGLLAKFLPSSLAYHLASGMNLAQTSMKQSVSSFSNSYRFWRDNEVH